MLLFFLKYNSAKIYLNFCTILSVCLLSILINFKFENDLIPFNLVKKDLDPIFLKNDSNVYKFANKVKSLNEVKVASTESGLFPYYSEAKTIDLFGLNTKEFSKRPAGGLFLKNNEFDLIIINTSQFGTLCVDLISALSQSKQLEPIEYQNRKVNWDKFTFQLISGINKDKYNTYIYPFYSRDIKSNNNTFIFINNKSTNF